MYIYSKDKFKTVFLIFLVFFSCANPRPPSGGPPDKTPPRVLEFSPKVYTTNFDKKEIYIKFNKWVDRNSVINHIFFNPQVKYQVSWSGKKMYLRFAEELPKNTTFSFLLGTNYNDLDGNKPQEPFSLVFSTGNIIDTGKIFGKVVNEGQQNIFVYSIPQSEIKDTILDVNKGFHYRTQPDNTGSFKFDALKIDTYVIFSFADKNNNKEFEYGIENFGICSQPFVVDNDFVDTVFIFLSPPRDEIPPILIDANAIGLKTIKLTFSEPIQLSDYSYSNMFEIKDTISKTSFYPIYALIDKSNPNNIFAFFQEELRESIYSINFLTPNLISDTSGNILQMDKIIFFRGSKSIDIFQPQIFEKQIFLPNLKDSILLTFSVPLDTTKTHLSIQSINVEQKDTTNVNYKFVDLNKIFLSIPNLKWRNSYSIIIKADTIFDFTGRKAFNFKHLTTLRIDEETKYGSIRGLLLAKLDTSFGKPMLIAISNKRRFYCEIVNNTWKFEQIPEDDYKLVAFYDSNKNGVYDFGTYKPFQFSEKIIKFFPKISVKKGWTVEEIRF